MGKKTSFILKLLAASLFVMLLTVFVMTDNVTLSSNDDAASVDTDEVADGTYTGSGEGFNGPIEVEVTVEGGEIANVEVLSHSESPDISDPAFENVPQAIIDNNSTDVDVASGATFSSEGIMSAVNNALSGDTGTDVEKDTSNDVSDEELEDGTHTGVAEGAHGPIEVEVTVTDGEITEVIVLDHNETEGTADPAIEETPQAIVENNSTDVDVASGATLTSEGIMAAVENALFGTEAASYEDGTYTATVDGHNEPIEVEVVVEDGEISEVTVLNHGETEDLSDPAIEDVPAAIVENNSTDVDVASGATVTSEAIMEAVELALEEASGETSEDVTYTDGTYEGSAEGHNDSLNVEVTVENGEISEVTVLDHSETEGLADPAIEDVPAAIVENNSTDVDVSSGATVTSEAIMDAVANALEAAN